MHHNREIKPNIGKNLYSTVTYSGSVPLCRSSVVADASNSASFLRVCSWYWSCWTLERVWDSSTKLCSTFSQAA